MLQVRKPRENRPATRAKARGMASSNLQSATLAVSNFRSLDPFPSTLRRRFKYADTVSLSTNASTGGFGSEKRLNLNALYDPDYSGSGHQPYGFDQLMAGYNKYRVERCSFKLTFTTPGGAADIFCLASVAPGTSSSVANTALSTPVEWPNTVSGHLSSTGTRLCVIRGSTNLPVVIGVTKARYDADDIFCGTVSANPSQLALLSFAVASYSGATSEACSCLFELEFDAVLFDRVTVASS